MIVDLHCHYPMHIAAEPEKAGALWHMTRLGRSTFGENVRALILRLASRWFNYKNPNAGPAVTVSLMREGGVRVALSVLYCPFDEADLTKPYGSEPGSNYFQDLLDLLGRVEQDIGSHHSGQAEIVRSPAEMNRAISDGKVAIVHAVEGGFHVGSNTREIDDNVTALAARGVAYITLAHLFFRGVATNAPALPFLADGTYKFLFPMSGPGLTALGEALIGTMVRNKVLIDITHMDESAMDETFKALDQLDSEKSIPVIASHIGCRFGKLEYNIADRHLREVAGRGGVVGIILCDHYMRDGVLDHQTKTFEESMSVIRAQIERIKGLTNSYDHIAIGTDLDGFIKPTLHGLDDASKLTRLEQALRAEYGASVAEQICSGNALRVLQGYWRSPAATALQQPGV